MATATSSRQVMEELDEFVEGIIINLTTNFTLDVSEATPKLTGYAASHWIPSLHAAVEGTYGPRVEGGISEASKLRGLADVEANYQLPDRVYITNPVDYITDLNMGTSGKAPAGFVQTSIALAIRSTL